MAIASINPATGELSKHFDAHSDAEIESALDRAVSAFEKHRRSSFAERAAKLQYAAEILEEDREHFARIITAEMGKLLHASVDEIEKCARGCRFYAEHGEKFLSEQIVSSDAGRSYVRYEPLGAVLAIMPWNFPFWQVFRFAAPALMAGNVGILKHASNVPGCSLAIEQVFRDAGFPPGIFASVLIPSSMVAGLIADPRIAAATLTGSERAGSTVAEHAGRHLKKTVLELGGSDPFIVLANGDVAAAARTAADARLINSGQSCIAAKRFIVGEPVADQLLERYLHELSSRRMGDPLARETQVGPQARVDLGDSLHQQIAESVKRGAKLLLGGEVPARKGAFYPPTLLAAVDKGMPAFDEETFGPVAAVIRAKDEADAVRLANDSAFGLGASLCTQDRVRAERMAAQIEAGAVFVNSLVTSDPRLPSGGIKRSEYGIREFVNIKSVWIA